MYTDEDVYDNNQVVVEKNNNSSSKGMIFLCVFLFIVLLVLLYFVFFKKDSDSNDENIIYTLTLEPSEINVKIGSSIIINATVKNSKNDIVNNPNIEWKIDDTRIADVDNGVIRGKSIGKTKVIASYTSKDGQSVTNSKDVLVFEGDYNIPLTSVDFSTNSLNMKINDTEQLSLNLTPPNGRIESKIFQSSNTSVVMVDSNGLVKAVGVGNAKIEVNINNSSFVKMIDVSVIDNSTPVDTGTNPVSVTINNKKNKINVREYVQLYYSIYPTNVINNTVTWTSSNPSVATVDANGILTGVSSGKATIMVQTNSSPQVIDMFIVEVIDNKKVIDIGLTTTTLNMTVGFQEKLTPIIIPSDATNKELDFIAGDNSIIQLNISADKSTVMITALKSGTTTITIKSSDGIIKVVNVIVNNVVTPVPTQNIVRTPTPTQNIVRTPTPTPNIVRTPTPSPKPSSSQTACNSCVQACLKNGGKDAISCRNSSVCKKVC